MSTSERLYRMVQIACRERLSAFVERAFRITDPPSTDGDGFQHNWHIDCICEHLEAARAGEIQNLIVNMPPRTLKTTLISIDFPAWVLGLDPTQRFIGVSFRHERAVHMTTSARKIVEDPWFAETFPLFKLSADQNQKHNWATTMGGYFYSSSIESVTGMGADYVLIDDPIAPFAALSDTKRASVNALIKSTLFSRLNSQQRGRIILVMQRVHEDDPTGHLLAGDRKWTHLKLPAEARSDVKIVLGGKSWEMKRGDSLFPARLGKEALQRLQQSLTEYDYAGQYLQEPVTFGGGEFKIDSVQYYKRVDPKTMNIAILVDPSGGGLTELKKKLGDYTAMAVVGLGRDLNYYLLDLVRDRLNSMQRVDTLFRLVQKWMMKAGKPIKVGYEQYGMMSDIDYIERKKREDGFHFNVVKLGGRMMKEERIRRMLPDFLQGRWLLPETLYYSPIDGKDAIDLTRELVRSEMMLFPKSKYDDCLDAISRIYDSDLSMSFPQIELPQERDSRHQSSYNDASLSANWMSFI